MMLSFGQPNRRLCSKNHRVYREFTPVATTCSILVLPLHDVAIPGYEASHRLYDGEAPVGIPSWWALFGLMSTRVFCLLPYGKTVTPQQLAVDLYVDEPLSVVLALAANQELHGTTEWIWSAQYNQLPSIVHLRALESIWARACCEPLHCVAEDSVVRECMRRTDTKHGWVPEQPVPESLGIRAIDTVDVKETA